jgi:hypothetical protein
MRTEIGNSVGLSRRGVISLGAAAAAVASATGARAKLIPQGLSLELVRLRREYEATHAAYLAASKQHDQAETRWYALKPKQPEELKRPFGYASDGPIWDERQLRHYAAARRCVPEAFGREPTEHERAEIALAEALIPVAEAYEAALDHARRVSNLDAVAEQYYSWLDAVDEVASRIISAPARSAADFVFKVRVLREWSWPTMNKPAVQEDDRVAHAVRILNDALALICGDTAAA